MKIDLELTWMEILNMARSGILKASDSDLEKACQVADIIRQAQKDGANFVKFVFVAGEIEVEIDSESKEEPYEPLDDPEDGAESGWEDDMGAV